jgi:hypothetical protein
LLARHVGDWRLTIAEPEGAEYWEAIVRRTHPGRDLLLNLTFQGAEREPGHVFACLCEALEEASVIRAAIKPATHRIQAAVGRRRWPKSSTVTLTKPVPADGPS